MSCFFVVLEEYCKVFEVICKCFYIEIMEEVLGCVDKVIIDDVVGGD